MTGLKCATRNVSYQSAVRGLFEIRLGSVQAPFGICPGFVRGLFGIRLGSVQAPFGPISDQNFRSQKVKISKIFYYAAVAAAAAAP